MRNCFDYTDISRPDQDAEKQREREANGKIGQGSTLINKGKKINEDIQHDMMPKVLLKHTKRKQKKMCLYLSARHTDGQTYRQLKTDKDRLTGSQTTYHPYRHQQADRQTDKQYRQTDNTQPNRQTQTATRQTDRRTIRYAGGR